MILLRLRPSRRARFAPMVAMATVLVLLLSFGAGPIMALAELCHKPCCTESAGDTFRSDAGDDCCAREAPVPNEPAAHGDCDEGTTSGCYLERCCDSVLDGVMSSASKLRDVAANIQEMPWHSFLTIRTDQRHRRILVHDRGSPPTDRLHLQLCTFLI